MKRISIAAALAAFSVSPAFAQEGAWGISEVHEFVSQYDPQKKPQNVDPFAVPVYPTVETDSIMLVGRLSVAGSGNTTDPSKAVMGYIEYNATTHRFEITVQTPSSTSANQVPGLNGRPLFSLKTGYDRRVESLGTRTNAYGASVNVYLNQSFSTAIAQVHRTTRWPLFDSTYPSGGYYKSHLVIEPEAARELSRNLEVRVYAKPKPLADGTSVVCTNFQSPPTFSDPIRYDATTCHLLVRFDKLEVVDTRDGNVVMQLLAKH